MSKKILVVDDSASVRSVIKTALEAEGYDVTQAVDGQDGLAKAGADKFNLIISDVNMPKMNGIEMVKALKGQASTKFIPVCMLTTESEQSKIEEGKAAGAKGWIVKPFTPPKLLAAVQQLVK